MRALLSDMGGGQWRVREAASLAMGDLLQVGRRGLGEGGISRSG